MNQQASTTIPTLEACRLMWDAVDFLPHSDTYPCLAEFASALAAVYTNGRVVRHSFQLPNHPVFDWYASRNRYHEMGFFERFWLRPSVKSAIPQQLRPLNFYGLTVFEWSSPFMLAGSLAWVLASGGPYERHRGGSTDAKRIADAAAEEVLLTDYDSPLLFISHVAWSDFFLDVAWDSAWVLVHQQRRLVHVILATDTD